MIQGIRKVISGRSYPRLLAVKKIPLYVSSTNTTYTSSTVSESGFNYTAVANMLIRSTAGNNITYAKIENISGNTIYIDHWTNGIPSNGTRFEIAGWVIDLDYAQKVIQTFEPYLLEHEVYRGRKKVKVFGFKYKCEIIFESFFPSDILIGIVNASYYDREKVSDTDYVLIPHKDKPGFNYNVYLSEPISLSPDYEEGYSGVRLVFLGKELVNLPGVSGYGTHYGYYYGQGL